MTPFDMDFWNAYTSAPVFSNMRLFFPELAEYFYNNSYRILDMETLKEQYRLQSILITSSSTSTSGVGSTKPVKKRRYDVFINHYKHPLGRVIYEELDAMGLKVFLNSEELQLEDEKAQRAITSAWLCIPIFSEDYAQSTRCLEELSAIRTRKDAKIVPIFSHVKPDDVRYAKGVYAAAFHNDVEHNSEKLQKWKEALYSVSHHTGLEVNSEEDRDMLLKKIPDWAVKDRKVVEEFGSDVLSRRDHLSHALFKRYETLVAWDEAEQNRFFEKVVFSAKSEEYNRCFRKLLKICKRRNVIRETHRAIMKENVIGLVWRCRKREYDASAYENFRLACDQLMMMDEEDNLPACWMMSAEFSYEEDSSSSDEPEVEECAFNSGYKCRLGVRNLNYDVFINHRGPDVKETLATDIYKKLKAMGLKPFLDKYELREGDHIPSVLEKVMKSAKLHIAINSKNYAESKWCLRELSFMQSETCALIIPVFYHCKLKDVRHSKGVFGKAFEAYKKKGRIALEKLYKWQEMLYRASFNLGPRLNSKEYSHNYYLTFGVYFLSFVVVVVYE